MSVIQNIRDKYARWAVIAIAVSLLGFILMDAFAGRTGLFSNNRSTTLGKVNGTTIDHTEFQKKVTYQESIAQQQAQQQGYQLSDEMRHQLEDGLWNQEVNNVILNGEYEKLGITVTDKEMNDVLYGAHPPQWLAQIFTDSTGKFDGAAARAAITRIQKSGSVDQKQYVNTNIELSKEQRLMTKYMSLLVNTISFPKWFVEQRNVDASLMSKISFVSIPFTTIPDNAVKVTDQEIKDYIDKHKNEFQQKDETRSIEYVLFSAAPSSADSADARDQLMKLRTTFDTTTKTEDLKQFVQANQSTYPVVDEFVGKDMLPPTNRDSVLAHPIGQTYGPYVDKDQSTNQGMFVFSKVLATQQWADTVKVRHILIATNQPDQQTRQMEPVRPDSVARHLADSVWTLLKKGQNFDSLAAKFSDDPGSKNTGGVMDNLTQSSQLVTSFRNFIFTHKTGAVDTVKSEFGYHIIEILSQKGSSPVYKIAYLTKDISASTATDDRVHGQANLFAGNSRDQKSFESNYDKDVRSKGIPKMVANDLTPMAYTIDGVPGQARPFIKKLFDADAGTVIGPERIGDNYVVAVVTDASEPGLRSVNSARSAVEPLLLKQKKGEQIVKNIGQVTSLEDVAAKQKQTVQTVDSLRFTGGRQLGYEPKVLGAIFNPANKGKLISEPLVGINGVYVVRVESVTTTPVENANVEEQRKGMEMQVKQGLMSQMQQQQGSNPFLEGLKNAATIKDYRAKFY